MTLAQAVKKRITEHGGVRNLAHNSGVDAAYISRLARGEKANPSEVTLTRLQITKVVNFTLDGEKWGE